jgi:hypothetical protein
VKGKYAARAANRTATAEQEAAETAYRRRILKLTEERDEARAERDKAREDLAKETRILRAQLAEGTSPRVEALTRELNRLREDRDGLLRWKKESQAKYGAVYGRIHSHFVAEHGFANLEAADEVVRLFEGGDGKTVVVDKGVEERFAERFGVEAALALRRSRRDGALAANRSVMMQRPTS